MKRNIRKIAGSALAFLFAATIIAGLTLFFASRPSHHVLRTWQSPTSVPYGPNICLSVLEGARNLDGFPLHIGRRYSIYAGRECGSPTYGHVIEYSFNAELTDISEHLNRTAILWQAEGVTLREPTGHTLFIPKASFLGGR